MLFCTLFMLYDASSAMLKCLTASWMLAAQGSPASSARASTMRVRAWGACGKLAIIAIAPCHGVHTCKTKEWENQQMKGKSFVQDTIPFLWGISSGTHPCEASAQRNNKNTEIRGDKLGLAAHTIQRQDHVGVHHNFCSDIYNELLQALLYAKDNCMACGQAGPLPAAGSHADNRAT